jgi:hypothetical protein
MAVVSKLEIIKEENLFNCKVMIIKVRFILITIAFFFTSFPVMNLRQLVFHCEKYRLFGYYFKGLSFFIR